MTDPHGPEAELKYELDWCRATLASIGDAVITADAEGRVTFLNSLAESLTGWKRQEAAGQPLDSVFRIVNPETRQPVESPTVRAFREDVVVGLANHSLLIGRDGTERPVEESAAPIRDEKGELAGVILAFRDTSLRLELERAVQKALTYANEIIATLREPFLVLDGDLRVRTANRSFYDFFQVSKEETENRLIYELGDGQWDIRRLRELLTELVSHQNRSFHAFEVEHDFPAVGWKIMLLNARRFPAEATNPELILLAIEDVTNRKQTEEKLKHSEARYRRLFETAKDGILILDAETGKIIDANPFMSHLLGYSHEEFVGKELWQIGVFRDKSANEAAFRQLQHEGRVRYEHLPLESKRGQQVEVEFVSNIYTGDEDRWVAQCNIRDITERSRLEVQAKEQAAELLDLHRRKDEFLAMLGHELRNPLAPISNAAQLLRLQQGNENPSQQQARCIIERQVGQLKLLVDELLEVSRITTGRMQLHKEQVAVNGIVENAVETARPLIDNRQHQLTVSLPSEPIWLYADAARLEQVVVNLLNNAAKYTEQGGHIWLTVLQEGDATTIRVRDTGIGVAPELLPRIFDLFTQAERSLDRSQGGLGIGLALVQRLVEMHGGRVVAHSVLGEGSEFVVHLPTLPTFGLEAPAAEETAPPTGRVLRVLVVDDNVDTAESLAMLVKASGHDVRTAYDGLTTLETALNFRPNVVLLDIGLPGLNGYEVAKRMRQEPVHEGAILVAMTGYGQESDRQHSQEAGFAHHLVKPVDFKSVRQVLATFSANASS